MLSSVLEKIIKLQPYFREQARLADETNRFPIKNFELVKKEGLLGLIVPRSFGGFGLNFLEYQHCIAELAKGCASTAASLNMHCIVLGALGDIPYDNLHDEQKGLMLPYAERIFNVVIKEQKVFASATSEPGIGARYSKTKTTYQPISKGYLINGIKSFVTMAKQADFYSIIASKKQYSPDEPIPRHALTFFIVPSNSPGIEIIEDWDTIGMRGTQSHQVIFKDVLVTEESAFLGITGFALMKVMQAPHWITGGYLGVYLGIMESTLNFTLHYIQERTNKESKTGLGYDPIIQNDIATLYRLYQTARYAVMEASRLIIHNSSKKETHQALYLAKYLVGENASQLTILAMKICGGMSLHRRYDLERYLRDSLCAPLMPLVSNACQAFIGKSLLELSTDEIW